MGKWLSCCGLCRDNGRGKNKKEGQPLLFAQLYESLFVIFQLLNIIFHDAKFAFQCRNIRFQRRYTDEDVALLVEVNRLQKTHGLAVKKLFERAWRVHEDQRYRRLAGISVSHIYNLRKSKWYKNRRTAHLKTRAHTVRIGERRKPQPKGHPGYLRVDTVHQGDWHGYKGVYHINAVDQVTQFEAVVSAERISELYLISAL